MNLMIFTDFGKLAFMTGTKSNECYVWGRNQTNTYPCAMFGLKERTMADKDNTMGHSNRS